MGSTDQFNIRWNNYTSVIQGVFRRLLEVGQFVDVTLACEGQSIRCHRVILSACSTYFDKLLCDNPTANMVIYIKDMKMWELKALITFMYNGEVSISQQKLPHLCKAAEALKVKGLAHDTGLNDGDEMEQMDEDDMEDYRVDVKEGQLQREIPRNSKVLGAQKSLLRQHNNLSAFAAAAAAGNRPHQQNKRKIMTQPPKLVKMQRVERPSNGTISGNGVSGNSKPQQHPNSTINKMSIKKTETETSKPTSANNTHEEEDDDTLAKEAVSDPNTKDEGDGDIEETEEVDGGDENESLGSEGDDSQPGQAARPNKIAMKYGKEVRDSALSALQSGMSLRQCSETYGIPKKTLSKWKSRELKQEGEEDATSPIRGKDGMSVAGAQGVILPPKTTMGAPVDSADRADRLKKATDLALSGVTVRQAAAHFDIPRTTLCAYMKRRGVAAKRNFFPNNSGGGSNNSVKRMQGKSDGNSADTNGQGGGSVSQYDDFPFLGISELMDEMGQAGYNAEAYAEGEEEYSEK